MTLKHEAPLIVAGLRNSRSGKTYLYIGSFATVSSYTFRSFALSKIIS